MKVVKYITSWNKIRKNIPLVHVHQNIDAIDYYKLVKFLMYS